MADAPLISVVVPAHNAGSSLGKCIDALMASDLPRAQWELIVVDDASTDETTELVQRADVCIRLDGAPHGPAFARNRGAESARAEVIAFVDADVCVHPDALRRFLDRLDRRSQLSAVFGSYDDNPTAPSASSRYRNLLHHYAHKTSSGQTESFWAGLGAIRAKDFSDVGKFNERRYTSPQIEDVELGYRLRNTGRRILLDPEILGTHLKEWTIPGIVRTDLLQRGVPWVRLLLQRGPATAAGGPSMGPLEMASVGLVGLTLVLVILWAVTRRIEFLAMAVGAVGISIALSARFHFWIWATGGPRIGIASIPLYLLYKLISVISVVAGTVVFLVRDSNVDADVSASRTKPARTFAGLASGEAGSRAIAFIATAYIARRLGVSAFGYLGFATAVVAYFGTALSAGISEIGAREVARRPDEARSIAAGGTFIRLLGALAGVMAVVAISSFAPGPTIAKIVVALTGFSLVSLALDTSWVYKGLGSTPRVGAALMLSQLIGTALLILLIRAPEHVARVPLIQFGADLLAAGFLAVPLLSTEWLRPRLREGIRLVRQSGLITMTRILRTFIVSIDVVLLGIMTTSAQVGLYSAAYRIVFFVMALTYASHISWLPIVTRTVIDGEDVKRPFAGSLRLSLAVTMPFVIGGLLIAPQLLSAVFGDAYAPAATALKLLLLSLLFVAVHGTTRNLFLAHDGLGIETAIMSVGVLLNVALNLYLIPRYGLNGAGFATAAAEGFVLIGCAIAIGRFGLRLTLKPLVAPAIAGALMAAGIIAIGVDSPVVLSILVGATIYAGSLVLLSRSTT
ncbi:MAG TPA: glycosyltransferase [Gemmatimonadaceae bacterium]|nr:glycosyltransferase [Gemmatimonadaceae bacterium]